MSFRQSLNAICFVLSPGLLFAPTVRAADPVTFTAEQEAFFENKVRPLLVARCFECHGPEKQKGNVRLDSREVLLKEGDAGPVAVVGKPEESRLIEVLTFQDSVKMPPAGKLSDAEIATLTEWVRLGMPFPKSVAGGSFGPATPEGIAAARKTHWSYQPVALPPVPEAAHANWPKPTEIDRFILAELNTAGLTPNRRADSRTLVRRLSYDLLGLPPDANDPVVRAFVERDTPETLAALVDHYLAKPEYGQRWGRHWLDVARYADTKGYVFTEERKYPYSYTYRDYVIDAFNRDLPYDEFVREQIAADRLPPTSDNRALAGLGFLTVGRRFGNNPNDIADDRIDVISRGILGLSVTCARCHDHKYDPIPTADYYALWGVLMSSEEPGDLPMLGKPDDSEAYRKFERQLAEKEGEQNQYLETERQVLIGQYRDQVREYVTEALCKLAKREYPADRGLSLKKGETKDLVVNRWVQAISSRGDAKDPVWSAWKRFAAIPADQFGAQVAAAVEELKARPVEGDGRLNARVKAAFETAPSDLIDVAIRYGTLLRDINTEWKTLVAQAAADQKPTALPDGAAEELRQLLYAENAAPIVSLDDARKLFDRKQRDGATARKRAIDSLKANSPVAPPRAMVVVDKAQPVNPYVFKRGNPGLRGDNVPRRFLRALTPDGEPYKDGSGRLELARDLTSPDNPLTARVFVNRVWMQHFGTGIVRTPSDFGIRGEPPTHPALLDYLAATFMADGWSTKRLHRRIVLSSVYLQDALISPEAAEKDSENRLLSHQNRRRLEFEALRDSLLAAAGRLDPALGGRPVDLFSEPFTTRRTVYGFIDRQDLPGLFRVFDFASPDVSTPQRPMTTVPQQALFAMNAGFVMNQAEQIAARPDVANATDETQRIRAIYQRLFQREPSSDELTLGRQYLAGPSAGEMESPLWQYGWGTYDPEKKRVVRFEPLGHFADGNYRGGPKLPDEKIGWVLWHRDGGHPGRGWDHVAIRRFQPPMSGRLVVRGHLKHPIDKGDGVRARLVSSRVGELAVWTAKNSETAMNFDGHVVEPGETLDFVVDAMADESHDGFQATMRFELAAATGDQAGSPTRVFDSKEEFAPPPPAPLNRLVVYIQALLETNEFVFVD